MRQQKYQQEIEKKIGKKLEKDIEDKLCDVQRQQQNREIIKMFVTKMEKKQT